jgi:hypothetical protein
MTEYEWQIDLIGQIRLTNKSKTENKLGSCQFSFALFSP